MSSLPKIDVSADITVYVNLFVFIEDAAGQVGDRYRPI